jgi:hypothetical protein
MARATLLDGVCGVHAQGNGRRIRHGGKQRRGQGEEDKGEGRHPEHRDESFFLLLLPSSHVKLLQVQ